MKDREASKNSDNYNMGNTNASKAINCDVDLSEGFTLFEEGINMVLPSTKAPEASANNLTVEKDSVLSDLLSKRYSQESKALNLKKIFCPVLCLM